ncbi:MAG: hypothetical protein HXY51_06825 [Nitrospirae bacterium]|nr:hypothetical protein [Nitrospirota bacterium]
MECTLGHVGANYYSDDVALQKGVCVRKYDAPVFAMCGVTYREGVRKKVAGCTGMSQILAAITNKEASQQPIR